MSRPDSLQLLHQSILPEHRISTKKLEYDKALQNSDYKFECMEFLHPQYEVATGTMGSSSGSSASSKQIRIKRCKIGTLSPWIVCKNEDIKRGDKIRYLPIPGYRKGQQQNQDQSDESLSKAQKADQNRQEAEQRAREKKIKLLQTTGSGGGGGSGDQSQFPPGQGKELIVINKVTDKDLEDYWRSDRIELYSPNGQHPVMQVAERLYQEVDYWSHLQIPKNLYPTMFDVVIPPDPTIAPVNHDADPDDPINRPVENLTQRKLFTEFYLIYDIPTKKQSQLDFLEFVYHLHRQNVGFSKTFDSTISSMWLDPIKMIPTINVDWTKKGCNVLEERRKVMQSRRQQGLADEENVTLKESQKQWFGDSLSKQLQGNAEKTVTTTVVTAAAVAAGTGEGSSIKENATSNDEKNPSETDNTSSSVKFNEEKSDDKEDKEQAESQEGQQGQHQGQQQAVATKTKTQKYLDSVEEAERQRWKEFEKPSGRYIKYSSYMVPDNRYWAPECLVSDAITGPQSTKAEQMRYKQMMTLMNSNNSGPVAVNNSSVNSNTASQLSQQLQQQLLQAQDQIFSLDNALPNTITLKSDIFSTSLLLSQDQQPQNRKHVPLCGGIEYSSLISRLAVSVGPRMFFDPQHPLECIPKKDDLAKLMMQETRGQYQQMLKEKSQLRKERKDLMQFVIEPEIQKEKQEIEMLEQQMKNQNQPGAPPPVAPGTKRQMDERHREQQQIRQEKLNEMQRREEEYQKKLEREEIKRKCKSSEEKLELKGGLIGLSERGQLGVYARLAGGGNSDQTTTTANTPAATSNTTTKNNKRSSQKRNSNSSSGSSNGKEIIAGPGSEKLNTSDTEKESKPPLPFSYHHLKSGFFEYLNPLTFEDIHVGKHWDQCLNNPNYNVNVTVSQQQSDTEVQDQGNDDSKQQTQTQTQTLNGLSLLPQDRPSVLQLIKKIDPLRDPDRRTKDDAASSYGIRWVPESMLSSDLEQELKEKKVRDWLECQKRIDKDKGKSKKENGEDSDVIENQKESENGKKDLKSKGGVESKKKKVPEDDKEEDLQLGNYDEAVVWRYLFLKLAARFRPEIIVHEPWEIQQAFDEM